MKWNDCKLNPPNKDGHYIIKTTNKYEEDWIGVFYYVNGKNINSYVNDTNEIGHWFDDYEGYICYDNYAYKWAEIDLDEYRKDKSNLFINDYKLLQDIESGKGLFEYKLPNDSFLI